MKLYVLPVLALASSLVSATYSCTPSPRVSPKLRYDFTISLNYGPSIEVGGINVYGGQQTYLTTTGGTFCATWNGGVSGIVVPGGTGTYLQVAHGTGPYKLDFEYLLKTNDKPPAYIFVKQTGWEVNHVGRTNYVMETGDPRYSAESTGVWIGIETSYIANATGTFSSVDGYNAV